MDCNLKEKYKFQKNCFGFILTMVAILLVSGGLIWFYQYHLFWKYHEWRFEPEQKKIPSNPMPKTDIPENWVKHSVDCMQFHLPPALYYHDGVPHEKSIFVDDNITVRVFSRRGVTYREILKEASRTHTTQKTFLTMSQLRHEFCGTAPNDFRWSMSRSEVRWHFFVISERSLYVPFTGRAETVSEKNWEGILFFVSSNRWVYDTDHTAWFEWQCISCHAIGGFRISSREEEQELDVNAVRGIVQSMKINCPCQQDNHGQVNDVTE